MDTPRLGVVTTGQSSLKTAMTHALSALGIPFELFALSRAIGQAVRIYPGPLETMWVSQVESICAQLGVTTSRMTVPITLLRELKEIEGQHLSLDTESGGFFIAGDSGVRLILPEFDDIANPKSGGTNTNVESRLIRSQSELPRLWLKLETIHGEDAKTNDHHLSPIQRLFQFLRPEAIDIAALSVLAFVTSVLAITTPIAAQQLVRTVTFGTLYQPIVILSLTLLLFLTFMASLQIVSRFVAEVIQQQLFARTAEQFARLLPQADIRALHAANGPEALNRFLEIVTVQKVVSGFVLDGMTVVFTTIIGMTLLALYHPFLLGYDIFLLILIAIVILVLGRGGTKTSIQESLEKYRVTAWLQDLARCPLAFRLTGASALADARTQQLTVKYLEARNQHFRVLIRQIICILGIQVVASTALLGLGGVLVLQEQMTLGQLVAAELVVAMIIGSLAKLLKQIEGFFDVMASMDKLGHVADLPLEQKGSEIGVPMIDELAEIPSRNGCHLLHENPFDQGDRSIVHRGRHLAIIDGSEAEKSWLADVLFGLREPRGAAPTLFGVVATDLLKEYQRQQVALIRDLEIFNGTLEENIHLGRSHLDHASVLSAIKLVGLENRLRELPEGMRTFLHSDGSPLTRVDSRLLMIARAVAGRPQLLIIDHLLDQLPDELSHGILDVLQSNHVPWTLLLLTGRKDLASHVHQRLRSD